MIEQQEIDRFRQAIQSCQKPIFFFDDDPDGLTSFLLLYSMTRKGKGVIVKSSPRLPEDYFRKAIEFGPDKVFVLDKPDIDQGFLDECKKNNLPVYWLDHHPVNEKQNVQYFNPRKADPEDNRPTAYWAYKISAGSIWQAMAGCVGDWQLLPDLKKEFIQRYPNLLPEHVNQPQEALFNTRLGELIRIISFNLKGTITEVNKAIKILTRVDDPMEILDASTSRARLLMKKYTLMNSNYEKLLCQVKATRSKLIKFEYQDNVTSFTSDLSNQLLYMYPEKVILLAREKNNEMKCSIRSSQIVLPDIIKKSLEGLEGYGGGHDHACGACVAKKHFDTFVTRFKKEITKAS